MSAFTFDTLGYVKRLKAANVPEAQAEAQAEALRMALSDQSATQSEASAHAVEKLDTKTERAVLKLDAKIDLVRSDLRGDINLLRWMMGITLAGVGAIFAKMFF